MVVTNTSLGVFAALTGSLVGSVLRSTWTLLFLAGILFFLAMSMFGFYSLQAPAWILNRIGGRRPENFLGLFFSGLVVGIFASPCIGPPVLALFTWVSTRADIKFSILAFFVLSWGLGFPYLVLGTFSGLIRRLPKSGTWLVWVERFFGVVMLGFAFFYLVLAKSA